MRLALLILIMPVIIFFTGLMWFASLWRAHLVLLLIATLSACNAPPHLQPRVIYATQEGAYALDIFGLLADGTPAPTTLPTK